MGRKARINIDRMDSMIANDFQLVRVDDEDE